MNWTVQLVDAVAKGPLWPKCAIFITWDDWGGWADRVDPPALEQWSDGSQFFPGGRVGCLVISPYAKRGYISKARHTHVSLVKFCEVAFGLSTINARDAASDGMEDCFDFSGAPDPTLPNYAGLPSPTLPATKKKRTSKKSTGKKSVGNKAAKISAMPKKTARKKKNRA